MTAAVGLVVGALTGVVVAAGFVHDTALLIILAAATVTAAGVLWRGLRKINEVVNFQISAQHYLRSQLSSTNGGGTIRDQIDRMEQTLNQIANRGDNP